MTTTSPADTGPAPPGDGADASAATGHGGRGGLRPLPVAVAAGLVALVCAVLLPLLPVAVSVPEVAWPADPADPASTALQLTTQRPLSLDARFDCASARAAAGTPDGVVLATMSPRSPEAETAGLRAAVRGDELTVTTRGAELLRAPLPPGPCAVGIRGDLGGIAVLVDGAVRATAPGEALPDVDALVTSVPPAPGRGADGLSVRLRVDDQFDTTATPLKQAVTVLLLVAVAVGLGALVMRDRAVARGSSARTALIPAVRGSPGGLARCAGPAADVVVVAAIVVWAFLAPMTDDDGYYNAMAGNVPNTGYVANYYQLYNQGFTPFTWIYYALSWWQDAIGTSPVLLRVPAALLGLATWVLVRVFVRRALPADERGTAARDVALPVALAVCFLGWWLPYDMGVRPEAVVALAVVASMVLLATATETGRWAPAAAAVGVASFGATAAPTGFVALAPLFAALPAVWRMLRGALAPGRAVLGLVALAAPGALVGVLAFADGSLRDFTRAQQIFLGMQDQETWYSEITRWIFLLSGDGAMGNYAKRAPVLLGVLALVAFLVLAAAARGRGRPLPDRFALAGTTTLLGFALLWLTPSKWTHHFGTLAGAGGVLLALVVVGGPLLLRDRPVRWPVVAGAGLLLALVMALAGHGTNDWPYSWMLGVPHAREAPWAGPFSFDQPAWWLLAIAVVAGAVATLGRRRSSPWAGAAGPVALAVATLVFLVATTGYMVGGLAVAAQRTAAGWSPWADAVSDPTGRGGVAAGAMQVLDPATARPMAPAEPGAERTVPAGAFVPGGWYPGSPPPPQPAAAGVPAWGSFLPFGTDRAPEGEEAVGELTTGWYAIPPRPGAAMTASVAGRTGGGNELRVEYARRGPDGAPVPVSSTVLGEGDPETDGGEVDATVWRSLLLEAGSGPPPGATMLRLVARDTSTAPGGWLAVTAPSIQRWAPLPAVLGPDRAVAVSWQFAFLFPGVRTPVQRLGINEPATAAVVWGSEPLAFRSDGIFQIRRGGLFAQSVRESEMTEMTTRLRDAPDAPAGRVYSLRPYVADEPGAYRLTPAREVVNGWSPAPNTTFSRPVAEDDEAEPE